MKNPKLFISYSWSNTTHEQWVIDLANELTESGIHVILDKWDLKEGHDSVAFMEKMVTDPEISKVAIVCDEVYASKADVDLVVLEQKHKSFRVRSMKIRNKESLWQLFLKEMIKEKPICQLTTSHEYIST